MNLSNYLLKNISNEITPQALEDVVLYWMLVAQKDVTHGLKLAIEGKGRYKRLNLKKKRGWSVRCGEISTSSPIHSISKLYVEFIHESGHLGISAVTE